MGTGVNHLVRRAAGYWFRRRIPRAVASGPEDSVARSLRTTDPEVARRRARACSAAFDRAMLWAMTKDRPPTRDELKRVLDDLFRRVLDDGERDRAGREPGLAPPWAPSPQDDPLYEGLEPEEWDSVPTEPERDAEEWWDSVLVNRTTAVEPLLDAAIQRLGVTRPPDGPAWRQYLRLALVVAADAHALNASRENSDYSGGFPVACRIPRDHVPMFGAETDDCAAVPGSPAAPPAAPAPAVPLFSESYDEFFTKDTRMLVAKTRSQATAVRDRFIAIVGDLPTRDIGQSVVETFKLALRRVPVMNGKSIYLGKPLDRAIVIADRIAVALARGDTTLRAEGKVMDRATAERHVARLSPSTVNRDIDLLSDWAKWMMLVKERRTLLQDGANPCTGMRFPKSDVAKARSEAGRTRRNYRKDEIALLVSNLPHGAPGDGNRADRARARRWAVLIGLYAGLRLSEIAQLRASQVMTEDGILYFDVVAEVGSRKKTLQSVRPVPVHPALIAEGLLDLVAERRGLAEDFLLPRPYASRAVGDSGSDISAWYTRFRRELGLAEESTVFHSLRHTFSTALKSSALGRNDLCDQIMGHEGGNTGSRIYTHPLPLPEKAALVASVNYGTVATQRRAHDALDGNLASTNDERFIADEDQEATG